MKINLILLILLITISLYSWQNTKESNENKHTNSVTDLVNTNKQYSMENELTTKYLISTSYLPTISATNRRSNH